MNRRQFLSGLLATSAAVAAAPLMPAGSVPKKMFVNVRHYGAWGDGFVDDTASIRGALAAVEPEGVLYFPAGCYRVNLIEMGLRTKRVAVCGEGHRKSSLRINDEGGRIDL